MKNRRFVKLINNERMNRKIMSRKACDATSNDMCTEIDNAVCTIGSYDLCTKDFQGGCTNNSLDTCVRDYIGCDNGSSDYCAAMLDLIGCVGANMTDY